MCYYVHDFWRTNPMSLVPGGSNVMVIYDNQNCRIYDKIKNPNLYIKAINMTGVIKILVDDVEVYNVGYA